MMINYRDNGLLTQTKMSGGWLKMAEEEEELKMTASAMVEMRQ